MIDFDPPAPTAKSFRPVFVRGEPFDASDRSQSHWALLSTQELAELIKQPQNKTDPRTVIGPDNVVEQALIWHTTFMKKTLQVWRQVQLKPACADQAPIALNCYELVAVEVYDTTREGNFLSKKPSRFWCIENDQQFYHQLMMRRKSMQSHRG